MPLEPDVSSDSPLRTFEKRGLPKSFASTYPHGHISGHARPPAVQKAFDARKATILRTMTAEQIEEAYQETVNKILAQLEEDRKKNEDIDRELQKLQDQRELERKLYFRQKTEKSKKGGENEVKAEED